VTNLSRTTYKMLHSLMSKLGFSGDPNRFRSEQNEDFEEFESSDSEESSEESDEVRFLTILEKL